MSTIPTPRTADLIIDGHYYISDVESVREIERDLIRAQAELIECERVRDQWCAEFVKARNALKDIYDRTDGFEEPDDSYGPFEVDLHKISSIARPWKDAQP